MKVTTQMKPLVALTPIVTPNDSTLRSTRKSVSPCVWLIVFFSFCCGTLNAQDSDDIWVLTYPEEPFITLTSKGQLEGFLVDEVNGILAKAGIQQKILNAPWERLEREARIKSNVLAFALTRTPEREPFYHWITPLTANVYAVFSSEKQLTPITSIDKLAALHSIAVMKDDVRHQILLSQGVTNIHTYANWNEAIDAVIDGRSSAVFFSEPGIQYVCAELGKDCNQLERVFLYEKTVTYLTLSKVGTDVKLVNNLKSAANHFKQSVKFKALSEYWLQQYKTVPIPMHMEDGVLNLWTK